MPLQFALGEFAAGMWWGRISDKFGRKPVLIGGLIGTLVSMMIFGFAKSYPVALLARAAGGLLNGNIGVIQTTLAELVPRKENQREPSNHEKALPAANNIQPEHSQSYR